MGTEAVVQSMTTEVKSAVQFNFERSAQPDEVAERSAVHVQSAAHHKVIPHAAARWQQMFSEASMSSLPAYLESDTYLQDQQLPISADPGLL